MIRFQIRGPVALLVVCASSIAGQARDSVHGTPGRIIGVFDSQTGVPLEGVQVRDAFSGTYAVTTATGTARADFLTFRGTAGFLELRKLGFQPRQIIVARADTFAITVVMERLVVLPRVTTTARYRLERDPGRWDGFEDRCRSGSATCIGADELGKKQAANIADLLIRAPGITIGACGGGRNQQCGHIAMKPTVSPPAYCLPTFFVDGMEWNTKMGSAVDLAPGRPAEAPYTPANVKAVEVYPSERNRPLRFLGDPTCGAIVIWTK